MMPPHTPQVLAILAALVEERTGLHYGEGDRDLFGERASARALEGGFQSLLDYYYFLRYDATSTAEFDALVESLVVGETYLFRERDQLEAAIGEYLVPAIAAGERPHIWSAACATGEEPLSLAMLLASRGVLDRVHIVASDVSERSLARARRGDLGRRALRGPVPDGLDRWLTVVDGRPLVAASLRAVVQWRRVNLTAPETVQALGRFDLIFCRNVLIYFRDETVKKVVATLCEALVPTGVLCVGVSESLLRLGTSLRCEERRGAFFYRKVERE
jgi:chemotaxis protein methyltransferase CheR